MGALFPIAVADEWDAAASRAAYTPGGYATEGFIHCSYDWQVLEVANRIFAGRHDLKLLVVDPARLDAKVVDENLEGGTVLYPHIYGPIPHDAVLEVRAFAPDSDGRFEATVIDPLAGSEN